MLASIFRNVEIHEVSEADEAAGSLLAETLSYVRAYLTNKETN